MRKAVLNLFSYGILKRFLFKVNREFENYGVRMFKAVDLGTVMSNASGLIFLVGKFLIAC